MSARESSGGIGPGGRRRGGPRLARATARQGHDSPGPRLGVRVMRHASDRDPSSPRHQPGINPASTRTSTRHRPGHQPGINPASTRHQPGTVNTLTSPPRCQPSRVSHSLGVAMRSHAWESRRGASKQARRLAAAAAQSGWHERARGRTREGSSLCDRRVWRVMAEADGASSGCTSSQADRLAVSAGLGCHHEAPRLPEQPHTAQGAIRTPCA